MSSKRRSKRGRRVLQLFSRRSRGFRAAFKPPLATALLAAGLRGIWGRLFESNKQRWVLSLRDTFELRLSALARREC